MRFRKTENGSIVSMRYDNANRLVYIGDNSATGLGFAYSLDANHNRITITENDGSQVNNTYDAKNRLTLEARTGTTPYSNGYSYDLNDNLTSVRGNSYSVDIMGKITNAGFVYDTNGRMTARPGSDGTTHLSYDYAGRVTSLTLANGFTIVHGLDGDGRMRSETRAGKRFDMILDGKDVLRESNITVTLTPSGGSVALRPRDLVRLPGATATYIRDITDYTYGLGLISQRTTVSRFFRWDGIGTLRNLEDSSKNIVASSVFDAYGLQQNAVTLASAYGFIGEEGVRGEKGLSSSTIVPQNMRARMYDPLTGRFTSRDPIWDKNLYAYANGNPWSFTDPDGMLAGLTAAQDPHGVYAQILKDHNFTQFRSDQQSIVLKDIKRINHEAGGRVGNQSAPSVQEFWRHLYYFQSRNARDARTRARATHMLNDYTHEHGQERGSTREILNPDSLPKAHWVWDWDTVESGAATGGAAILNVITFNQTSWLYDPGEYRNMPGFDASVASATIGREALLFIIPVERLVAGVGRLAAGAGRLAMSAADWAGSNLVGLLINSRTGLRTLELAARSLELAKTSTRAGGAAGRALVAKIDSYAINMQWLTAIRRANHLALGRSIVERDLGGRAWGETDIRGDITIQSGLSPEVYEETLGHELSHSMRTPATLWRAEMGMEGYARSHLLLYLEEVEAEFSGTGRLLHSLSFPIAVRQYFVTGIFSGKEVLSAWRVFIEGRAYTLSVVGTAKAARQLKRDRRPLMR